MKGGMEGRRKRRRRRKNKNKIKEKKKPSRKRKGNRTRANQTDRHTVRQTYRQARQGEVSHPR